jgi:hypothetical protein
MAAAREDISFFIKAVEETVVNNLWNRFTVVEFDNMMFYPVRLLSTLHRYNIIFTSGPCLWGWS